MYPIVRKETLADNIILMDIKAPRVANEWRLSPSWYRRLAQEPSV